MKAALRNFKRRTIARGLPHERRAEYLRLSRHALWAGWHGHYASLGESRVDPHKPMPRWETDRRLRLRALERPSLVRVTSAARVIG
jgi:hypothetical protein